MSLISTKSVLGFPVPWSVDSGHIPRSLILHPGQWLVRDFLPLGAAAVAFLINNTVGALVEPLVL